MFSKLLLRTKYAIGFKDMKKSFFEFLNLEAGAVYRGAPEFRQRKYLNVQIAQKFKELQAKRKHQHLMFAQKRKKLLEKKISSQAKLLTQYQKYELTKINDQIKSIQSIIDEQSKELAEIEKNLQETEAEYILVDGPRKLVVLNEIIHLRHVNSVPSGVVLTPESIKVIENVHYLVTHNLPVPRFKLYELLPDLFTKQIGQLEESAQKLIAEKNLNIFQEITSYSIRRWARHDKKIRDPIDREIIKLKEQRQNMMVNLTLHSSELLKAHTPYINKVSGGQTVFRNMEHCLTVLMSQKLNISLNEQEEAFKKTILEIHQDFLNYRAYRIQNGERVIQIQHSYIEPAPYIKNHPVLMKLYDEYMERYTNPYDLKKSTLYFPKNPPDDDGRAWMEERLRKEVEKFDQEFLKLWKEDKSQLMANKKKSQIEFYNFSTRILEEYQALEDKSKSEQEFKKLPKRPKRKEEKYVRITTDQLTKMIYLNNQNKSKYNLEFFSKYFGMEEPEQKKYLFDMLNSVSYLRVIVPQEDDPNKDKVKEIKQKVLKFIS